MGNSLSNKTAVVIGASSGLGYAVANAARAEGARVVAISRSGSAPAGIEGLAADVNDCASIAAALTRIGTIDHLVYTAGARTNSSPLSLLETATLRDAFDTKLFSAIQVVRLALPYLAQHASITLTSGQVSRKFGVGTLAKGALNAAVDAAGKHLAKELAPRRVNVISPGVVDTDIWGEPGSQARQATIERVSASLPLRRIAAPEELAQAYLFAMTNSFVTGAVLDIDGGGLL
jgi:NAD(P)-dependent dehydrogenase (short-subunit alcohol dehydrogenase family)